MPGLTGSLTSAAMVGLQHDKTGVLSLDAATLSYPLLLDPTFSITGNLVLGRGQHTATLLPNGKVLLAGGYWAGGALAQAEESDRRRRAERAGRETAAIVGDLELERAVLALAIAGKIDDLTTCRPQRLLVPPPAEPGTFRRSIGSNRGKR